MVSRSMLRGRRTSDLNAVKIAQKIQLGESQPVFDTSHTRPMRHEHFADFSYGFQDSGRGGLGGDD